MEKVLVNNFLVIKKAEFDVGKINIIIGPQANGKSVLAKLLYFFREFLNSTYLNSVKSFDTKNDVEKKGLSDFEKYFPKYTWVDQNFNIIYQINDVEISIRKQKPKKGETSLKLDYSANLVYLHRRLKNVYKKKMQNNEAKRGTGLRLGMPDAYWETLDQVVYHGDHSDNFNNSLFIPASRSFFANLQKNVFSFLASNIDIDPFISDFGSQYETAKSFYERGLVQRANTNTEIKKKADHLIENILVGKYKYDDDKDWIISKNKRVNLTNASSGQQEALPMLLIMSVWPFLGFSGGHNTFFIEEPEAHIFPVSQKHIISLIALIYKNLGHRFIITTHSPYILTAINNMILLNDIKDKVSSDDLGKQFDFDFSIVYEDVRAFTFKDGELVSIMDDEARLIGESIIDSVSDEFENEFDRLLSFLSKSE